MNDYNSKFTGSEIDEAISRAIPGGAIDVTLQNKAPAGYGLGTTPKLITDWNDAKVCGWFRSQVGAANAPTSTVECFGRVDNAGSPEAFVQEVLGLANANKYYHWIRLVYTGTGNGTPWEWVNPPMEVGVEYRTTERFLGRPVYYKIVDCGQIADNKQVEHGIANMRDCISFQGLRGGMPMPSISNNNLSDPWSYYVADVDRTKITLACGTSAAGGNCHVMLKYTKTTD